MQTCSLLRFFITVCILAVAVAPPCHAADPHLVGWVNTFIPGSGEVILGHPLLGGTQAILEGTTFGYGYSLSARKPMTIDGVPENLEVLTGSTLVSSSTKTTCIKVNAKGKCIQTGTSTVYSDSTTYSNLPIDDRNAGYADILQEFGLKYHMVNVFNAYREAAGTADLGQGIDQRPTGQMFMDPFHWTNLSNPWVYTPLILLTAYTVRDYIMTLHSGVTQLQPMNGISNQLLSFNYEVWQPFGSGAPEEMFYRGFLQNELYCLVPSAFFSIPIGAAAFAFSHAAPGRPTAAVAGTYLGFLADHNHGNLGPGIALHFWTVVLLGIETIALTDRAQGYAPLKYVTFDIDF